MHHKTKKKGMDVREVGQSLRRLENKCKLGQARENAKALVAGGSDASGRLLSDYEGLEAARMARTPRTAPQRTYFFPIGFAILFHQAHTS
jgi:pre-mRNA-splicing factor CDC5/CEF1